MENSGILIDFGSIMGSSLRALSTGLHVEIGFFNMGVIPESVRVYIETGISQIVPYLDEKVKAGLGIPGPEHIIIPHSHFDHAGGATRWKKLYPDVKLWGSPEADAAMRNPVNAGLMTGILNKMNGLKLYRERYPEADETVIYEPLALDGILKDGAEAPGGLKALSTPGHTACSISLWHEASGTAFVSDAAGVRFPGGKEWVTAFDNFDQYLESLDRIMALGAGNLVFGHNGMIEGHESVKKYLSGHKENAEQFRDRAKKLVREQGLDGAISEIKSGFAQERQWFLPEIFHWGIKTMLKGIEK